jgi:hypothetical protein
VSIVKKFNNWFYSKPKNPKVYLIIGIIFFAVGAFIAGTQGGGLVNGTINTITGSLGIFLILKYFYSGKKID